MDLLAHRLANRLAGNPESAAAPGADRRGLRDLFPACRPVRPGRRRPRRRPRRAAAARLSPRALAHRGRPPAASARGGGGRAPRSPWPVASTCRSCSAAPPPTWAPGSAASAAARCAPASGSGPCARGRAPPRAACRQRLWPRWPPPAGPTLHGGGPARRCAWCPRRTRRCRPRRARGSTAARFQLSSRSGRTGYRFEGEPLPGRARPRPPLGADGARRPPAPARWAAHPPDGRPEHNRRLPAPGPPGQRRPRPRRPALAGRRRSTSGRSPLEQAVRSPAGRSAVPGRRWRLAARAQPRGARRGGGPPAEFLRNCYVIETTKPLKQTTRPAASGPLKTRRRPDDCFLAGRDPSPGKGTPRHGSSKQNVKRSVPSSSFRSGAGRSGSWPSWRVRVAGIAVRGPRGRHRSEALCPEGGGTSRSATAPAGPSGSSRSAASTRATEAQSLVDRDQGGLRHRRRGDLAALRAPAAGARHDLRRRRGRGERAAHARPPPPAASADPRAGGKPVQPPPAPRPPAGSSPTT